MSEQRMYRGKRVDNGEWVKGWYIKFHNIPEDESWIIKDGLYTFDVMLGINEDKPKHLQGCYKVIPESVGQSTGRKTKDDVEIYGGDEIYFIPCGRSGKKRCTGIVYYCNKRSAFCVKGKEWDCQLDFCNNIEITDNPELLQETDR